MYLQLLTREAIPHPEALKTNLKDGVVTKRHEFIEKNQQEDAFVVFGGEEQTPFWRRSDGIRFVYTNLDYSRALATADQQDSFLDHTIVECDGSEFLRYYREAWNNHKADRY